MNTRIKSGLVLGFLLISLVLLLPNRLLEVFAFILTILSFREFLMLRFKSFTSIISCCFLLSFILIIPWWLSTLSVPFLHEIVLGLLIFLGIIWWVLAFLLILFYPLGNRFLDSNIYWIIAGLLFHGSFWASILSIISIELEVINISIFSIELSRFILLSIAFISISMDSFAYLVGKKIGLRKLSPNISPNKTIEGFIAALFITIVISLAINYFIDIVSFFYGFIFIGVLCVFSVLGDLTESMFKRMVGVKDSSNIIPGHGGILDRLDSHLATFPIAVFLVIYLFL